ncbi:MAG: hypothetical protein ABIT09_11505 [Croceibacterium sp.]
MSPLEKQFAEDRATREAALRLVKSDLGLVKADIRERGVAARIGDRLGDSAMDLADDAVDFADSHKGALVAVAAAIVAWFARRPIIDGITGVFADDDPEEPETLADRLRDLNPFKRE